MSLVSVFGEILGKFVFISFLIILIIPIVKWIIKGIIKKGEEQSKIKYEPQDFYEQERLIQERLNKANSEYLYDMAIHKNRFGDNMNTMDIYARGSLNYIKNKHGHI